MNDHETLDVVAKVQSTLTDAPAPDVKRTRARMVVEWDLDPVYGWNHQPEDVVRLVQRYLEDGIPHYRPTVTLNSDEVTR